ncbi:MAG TPA: hypothetical protein VN939_07360 [Chthoniobacterales bacterium]|jgi:hypothetical protein|nr:hypothetical protein [Chthoniobacterales bacterium]
MTYEEFVIQASLEAAEQVAGPALAVQSAMQLADELVARDTPALGGRSKPELKTCVYSVDNV